ncbi:MAG: tetratricopeptide repeat protein [Candidatus Kapaibacterium sp.]
MKRKRNILFWLISILCIVAFSATKLTARQRLIDSLESKLNQHRKQFGNDTNTVNILYNLSITVAKRDPRESDLYGRQVIDISNKLSYERGNVLGLFHLGDMALIDKNLAKTKELYLKALSIAKSIKAKDLQIVSLCLLSDLDGTLGNISSAFELGHNAYKLSNELASNELVSKSCQTLMLVYSRLSQNIQAQLYGKKCIEFAIKTKNILYIFNAYSTYFCFSNDTINSNEFSSKALEITQYEGWKISEGVINLNLGWGEYDKKNITKALQFFKNSLAITEEVNNYKPQITYATCGIASCYVEMKVYDKAIYYAKRSMELCKFFKFPNLITQNSITLSKCYEKLNDYQNAFYYMDTNRMYNDTLFNTEILQKTTAIQVKAETDKKNSEIAIVEKEKDYQTFLRNTAIVGFILIFIIVVLLYHSYKLRKKSDESLITS